ncbi:MAG: HDOD domain-containing protein [Deltaproteobacteria bacterium]|nr:HDOD domain-containing protein [Deltaproteobacteria bacterium]MBK8236614.1 HDOD domain-containing protein [Deltaproteobacteria bacterium]MBK8717758.1 HDOD domain-containing protein [Deltaproteobacteria bacterium]MBP7288811.1 HDOD domain-containing protein [Nannocystaceae bacterium]
MSGSAAVRMPPAPAPLTAVSADADSIDDSAFDDATRRALDWLRSPRRKLSALPAAVADLMAVANSREANFREVDRVVRACPVVAARVLSVANSPLYRPPAPITSLRMALMRLGWGILREILLQAIAEAHLFRGGARRQLNATRQHSIAIAHVHRHVAQVIGFDTEHAFACGLLHDIGRPTILGMLLDPAAPTLSPEQQQTLVDAGHGWFGARLCGMWNLPEVVSRVCLEHHRYEVDDDSGISQAGVSTVAICEALVCADGFASEPAPTPEQAERLLARLGLPPHELASLRSTALLICQEAG